MDEGDLEGEEKTLPNGKAVCGKVHEMKKGVPVMFSPRAWHEVQSWRGERLVMLLYTPRATRLPEEGVVRLEEAGFNVDRSSLLPDDEEEVDKGQAVDGLSAFPVADVKVMFAQPVVEGDCAFVEMEGSELFQGECGSLKSFEASTEDDLGVALHVKKMVKKAEVQCTPDIESIIKDIETKGGQLEVTHTVSLADVKSNIDKWKMSALKEFNNLTESKRAFTVKKRHELPHNCRIVPCKGVYTVKPDKASPGYRRKTRFVACGNHVPEEDVSLGSVCFWSGCHVPSNYVGVQLRETVEDRDHGCETGVRACQMDRRAGCVRTTWDCLRP